MGETTYLLITNGEFPSSDLILVRKLLDLLDRLTLKHRNSKLDVRLGVLMTRLLSISLQAPMSGNRRTHINNCVIRQLPQPLIQRLVHLLGIALKEPPTPTDEQRVAREHRLLSLIFHKVADAVLRVTGRVHAFDGDVAELEG